MASLISDGIGGLETTHVWNGFTFNDLTATDAQAKAIDITGLYSRPEFSDPRFPNTGRRGEHVLPGALGGKTVVYEGVIRAKTLADWKAKRRAMSGACLSTGTFLLTIEGVDDEEDEGIDWVALGRCIDCDIDEKPILDLNDFWPFQGEYSVSIRLEDGRFLALAKNTSASQSSAATLAVTNSGNGDAEPDFGITGTGTWDAVIENLTIGKKLVFVDLPAGVLNVSFHYRTALIDGDDASEFLDGDLSDWWDEFTEGLRTGVNNIKVTGGDWTIGWYHTDA